MRTPEFWTSNSAGAAALAALLSPIGALYGFSVRARQASAKPFRSRARVLCIGNLTAGGSGKTPVALALGSMLRARGKTIAFLTRGYGGRSGGPIIVDPARHSAVDVGDEALLLTAKAPTIVAHDRAAGAALADSKNVDLIVMDDGFQNFQLTKDLSILVIDAETGLGNRRLIPAGPLREPPETGFKRADGLILMGTGEPKLPFFDGPCLRARLIPTAPESVAGRAVHAIAGIGRPEKFFATLLAMGARITGTAAYADHHRFSVFELAAARTAAEAAGALLVTTEKDYLRLDERDRAGILPIPVHVAFDDAVPLRALLDRLV
jgi:tetraacyldisaccharide 4'-kinase